MTNTEEGAVNDDTQPGVTPLSHCSVHHPSVPDLLTPTTNEQTNNDHQHRTRSHPARRDEWQPSGLDEQNHESSVHRSSEPDRNPPSTQSPRRYLRSISRKPPRNHEPAHHRRDQRSGHHKREHFIRNTPEYCVTFLKSCHHSRSRSHDNNPKNRQRNRPASTLTRIPLPLQDVASTHCLPSTRGTYPMPATLAVEGNSSPPFGTDLINLSR